MWRQVRQSTRNALLTVFLVGFGMLIYNVLILRGRSFEWYEYDRPKWTLRSIFSQPEQKEYPLHFSTKEYQIRLLPDGQYERRLNNNSLMPYLVTMYEFKEWKYKLPAPILFRYAERYAVKSLANKGGIDSGWGFDCGTGLGQSLIRPFEVFIDTVSREELIPKISVHYFVSENGDEILFDRLTRQVYGPITAFDNGEQDRLLELMPNDSLNIRFYLPVKAWTNLARSRFESNPIKISRRELISIRD